MTASMQRGHGAGKVSGGCFGMPFTIATGERGPIWYCTAFVHSNPRKRL